MNLKIDYLLSSEQIVFHSGLTAFNIGLNEPLCIGIHGIDSTSCVGRHSCVSTIVKFISCEL